MIGRRRLRRLRILSRLHGLAADRCGGLLEPYCVWGPREGGRERARRHESAIRGEMCGVHLRLLPSGAGSRAGITEQDGNQAVCVEMHK
jgi:hypothetical protein